MRKETAEQQFLQLVKGQLQDKNPAALLHQARNTRIRLTDGRYVRLRTLKTAIQPEREVLIFDN